MITYLYSKVVKCIFFYVLIAPKLKKNWDNKRFDNELDI